MTSSIRITKRVVDQLRPGEIIWDTDVKGFAVRCQKRSKVYVLKVRISGRQRWLVIGDHGSPWTAEKARHEAQRLWGEIRGGVDIAHVRDAKRTQGTVAELCERYLDEHARQHKKPLSVASDERNIVNHIIPLLGRRPVAEVSRADIDDMKRAIKNGETWRPILKIEGRRGGRPVLGGPGAANRTLCLMSKMFALAEEWGWRPDNSNPCKKVQRYKGKSCERFLSSDEFARLGAALAALEDNRTITLFAAAAFRLLIYTGARLGEIQTLQWSFVDLERKLLHLPDSKTGAKPIILNKQAVEVLDALPHIANNPFVFAGHVTGQAIGDLQRPWQLVRAAAGLPDVRIHDLRHSFASFAVLHGGSLPIIGKLLGHTTPVTTARYAHLGDDPLRQFNQKVGEAIADAMQPLSTLRKPTLVKQ